ncbi:MAG: hypothetical protein CMG47_02210 [Candidatus Marinimicrobia bacterium]|nr:hypothetical protein [Candidatus Neomarinimicrobiota bacterium]
MKNPNLFIVGAPKSGTTFLYYYLKQHPDIYFPNFKEPHFFGSDLIRRNGAYNLSLDEYQDLFKTDKKIIGEASTFYIFSKDAPEEIYNFNPKAKIIIMLRDLVDLVHSLHSQFVFSGDEVIEDFTQALELEDSRLSGNRIPNQTTVVNKLFYTSNILSLPRSIQSFIRYFGRENIKFIDLDDIKKNPKKVYFETLEFLNIDSNLNIPDFKIINKNKTYKSKTVRDFIKKYSIFLGSLRSKVFKKPLGLIKALESANKSENNRAPIPDDLYIKLKDKFSQVDLEIKNIINKN